MKNKLKKRIKGLEARIERLEKRMDEMPLISYTDNGLITSGYSYVVDPAFAQPATYKPILGNNPPSAGND